MYARFSPPPLPVAPGKASLNDPTHRANTAIITKWVHDICITLHGCPHPSARHWSASISALPSGELTHLIVRYVDRSCPRLDWATAIDATVPHQELIGRLAALERHMVQHWHRVVANWWKAQKQA